MVKLLVSVAGAGFSHAPGEKVTLDKDFERRLIESGQAEPVRGRQKKAKPDESGNDN